MLAAGVHKSASNLHLWDEFTWNYVWIKQGPGIYWRVCVCFLFTWAFTMQARNDRIISTPKATWTSTQLTLSSLRYQLVFVHTRTMPAGSGVEKPSNNWIQHSYIFETQQVISLWIFIRSITTVLPDPERSNSLSTSLYIGTRFVFGKAFIQVVRIIAHDVWCTHPAIKPLAEDKIGNNFWDPWRCH